jgi:hypothetical protein
MSKKANYSLSLFEMGAIANDGTMGTSLTAFDDPVRDTCVLQMADGTKQNFMSEISDYAYYSVNTPGDVTIKADFYAKSASQLVSVFGGTATAESGGNPEMWNAPASQVTLEQSVRLTHKNGKKISLVRVSLTATFEWNFKRSALPLIHFTGTVLQPSDPTTGLPLAIAPFFFTGVVGS